MNKCYILSRCRTMKDPNASCYTAELASTDDESSSDLTSSQHSSMMNSFSSKSVTFREERNEMHHIEHVSSEECNAIWWSQEEFKQFELSINAVIVAMATDSAMTLSSKNDQETFRGLESWTPSGFLAREENRSNTFNAVLDEQDRQWDDDAAEDDQHDTIARVSSAHSKQSVAAAAARALDDERETFESYLSDGL
jgi:hypothetical protein